MVGLKKKYTRSSSIIIDSKHIVFICVIFQLGCVYLKKISIHSHLILYYPIALVSVNAIIGNK